MRPVFSSFRSIFPVLLLAAAFQPVAAADAIGIARGDELPALAEIDRLNVPVVDREARLAEDVLREAEGLPFRYAIANTVSATPKNHGAWHRLEDGTRVWRLRAGSPGARSLNLGFSRYHLPDGARLHIYSSDLKRSMRPFTAKDNAAHGELWTPILHGDELVIELVLPPDVTGEADLKVAAVNVGYRDFGEPASTRSGSCNVDVVCNEGDDWRNEIPSVGAISTGGSIFCTGFMVNNTARDRTPYFMTANHCGIGSGNAASLVVYWNFETDPCGGSPNGSLADFQTGAFFRASYSPSDFTLVELDEEPDPDWGVTYSGWDHSGDDTSGAIAIHHPSGDEKRISFEDDPTTTTSYLSNAVPGDGTHVRVTDWDLGTTEPGSSGSPLFDPNHRVIGQLHGGYASCSSQTSDWYGRLSVSWNGGGSASSRLSDWLDPVGSGEVAIDTLGLGPVVRLDSYTLDDGAGNSDGIVDPGESLTIPVTARNSGSEPASGISATLTSSSPDVQIVDGSADWPDMAQQEAYPSNAPHYSVDIDPNTTCGESVTMTLDFTANEGNWTSRFDMRVGEEGAPVVTYTDDMELGLNGWTESTPSGTNNWVQTTADSASPTHSWFVADIDTVSDSLLVAPTVNGLAANSVLRFEHRIASESTYDGGVLEYSTDGSTWNDAGSMIIQNGYNGTISTSYSSPIGGRSAWYGSAGAFEAVAVDLSSLEGQNVTFRWRFATDSSVSAEGWYVDDVEISSTQFNCSAALTVPGEASGAASAAPLRISRVGGTEAMTWSAPASGGPVDDYALYSMPLGSFGTPPECETALGMSTSGSVNLAGNRAFLVVARNAAGEGSYGRNSVGEERPTATTTCP